MNINLGRSHDGLVSKSKSKLQVSINALILAIMSRFEHFFNLGAELLPDQKSMGTISYSRGSVQRHLVDGTDSFYVHRRGLAER